MTDPDLSPEERDAFAALPREMPVPAGLEDRVAAAIRAGGGLSDPPVWRRPALALAAAAILLAGWGTFMAGRASVEFGASSRGDEYLLLLYGGETASAAEESGRVAEYSAWADQLKAQKRLERADRLGDEARVAGAVMSGVALSPKPVGFFLVRARSFHEAETLAVECPHTRHGGTVVVHKLE